MMASRSIEGTSSPPGDQIPVAALHQQASLPAPPAHARADPAIPVPVGRHPLGAVELDRDLVPGLPRESAVEHLQQFPVHALPRTRPAWPGPTWTPSAAPWHCGPGCSVPRPCRSCGRGNSPRVRPRPRNTTSNSRDITRPIWASRPIMRRCEQGAQGDEATGGGHVGESRNCGTVSLHGHRPQGTKPEVVSQFEMQVPSTLRYHRVVIIGRETHARWTKRREASRRCR